MKQASFSKVLSAAVFLMAVTMQPSGAQEARATLGGRVLDPQGAAVPNADVVVRSDSTGVEQTTKTNEQGNWTVRFLIPGNYSIRVLADGFKQAEQRGIALQTADQKQVDIQLEVGSTSTQIEVTAEAPLIDTTAATSGTVIAKEQIAEMPSMSRIVTILATLSPGVLQQDQNQNVAHLWSHDAGSQISANGGQTKQPPAPPTTTDPRCTAPTTIRSTACPMSNPAARWRSCPRRTPFRNSALS